MMQARFHPSARAQSTAWLVILLAILVAAWGFVTSPERTWGNLLVDGYYAMSLALSAAFFIASQRLAGARWSAGIRRIPEALMLTLPVAAALMVLLYLGRKTLFPWAHPGYFDHEPAGAGHVEYLKPTFVYARISLCLSLWLAFAWLLRRTSLRQDNETGLSLALHFRLNKYAAAFVVVFAVTFTISVYDWISSLDPHWFSTMFAVYIFSGTYVQGIAAITLATLLLNRSGALRRTVDANTLHCFGTMLFAFSIFWSYIWTCQYLLIWYGNIPEEVTHYVLRTNGNWVYLFALNPVLNGAVPFLVLMSSRAKRRPKVLVAISVLLLAGHWLDLYLQIMPSLGRNPHMGWTELGLISGYVAIGYLGFVRNLARAPLFPLNDPILSAQSAPGSNGKNMRHVDAMG